MFAQRRSKNQFAERKYFTMTHTATSKTMVAVRIFAAREENEKMTPQIQLYARNLQMMQEPSRPCQARYHGHEKNR